jgi:uncharacterized protein YxjI
MGIFSGINRFHAAGQEANTNYVEQYGQPVKSLYTSTKILTLHHQIDVTDEQEQVVYQARTKVFTLHDSTEIVDAAGNPVASIRKKLFSFHERHFISMANGTEFQFSNELFHLIKDVTNIEELGWQLRGNVLGINFELFDADGSIIATTSQKLISMHNKYCIDLYRPEHEQAVVAILITLQHMLADREKRESSSTSNN